jgi:catechol 2,3-dioxygenase-like lactoylglutathione lyase family enzyme
MSEVIDHVGIRVSDLATSRRMYEAALAELGFAVLGEGEFGGDAYVLFGRDTSDDFALHAVGTQPGRDRVTTGAHIAFRAPDTVSVRRWHAAAIDNAGTDNGRPVCAPSTAAATTLRSRSTRTATTSKLCSTHLSRP